MTVLIITEKPSQGRAFGKALGAAPGKPGNFEGEDFIIVSARGHLYELAPPEQQVDASLVSAYQNWDTANLPWDHTQMAFKNVPMKGVSAELKTIQQAAKGATEIAIGTDVDPSGEGGLIAGNIILELGLDAGRKLTRMYFTDEAASSVQKAFRERKQIASVQDFDEYRKASYRSNWDFLSMQFTRVATVSAAQRAVLRQGRLKSAMLLIVGDQLKAYTEYVRKPFFQNRFRDDHGVMYVNPEEPRHDTQDAVDTSKYATSSVVVDSKTMKSTKPPRLLDLAALSARLSGKSFKADQVLKVYQAMYEAGIVSYPRTEDKHITSEQFKEMLPIVDAIAGVAGVDPAILTVRSPRKTHVKDTGAHGANRPGMSVPKSLEAVEQAFGKLGRLIYEEVSRSFLAMFAEDYQYEAQEGHLQQYPEFMGAAAVPKVRGWKDVFFEDTDEDDEEDTSVGLGSTAEPFIHEGANQRPPHPTMKWLMKQLERRDVGTGATRTSTYAEVTNQKTKFPLMAEARGKLTLTETGDMGYRILPNTKIGDLTATEQVFNTMDEIAVGKTSADQELGVVADWVAHDIDVMKTNAAQMHQDLGLTPQAQAKEKATGMWNGQDVSFSREWGGVRFTDDQVAQLLAGQEISFEAVSKRTGNTYTATGKLAEQEFKGRRFVGFKPDFGPKKDANGNEVPPSSWCKVQFTDAQVADLQAGKGVKSDQFVSKKGKKFTATVHWKEEKGQKRLVPSFG